jgi:hypothetical protein
MHPKALYVHCFGHALHLSVRDAGPSIPLIRDDVVQNLSTIVHGSAKA